MFIKLPLINLRAKKQNKYMQAVKGRLLDKHAKSKRAYTGTQVMHVLLQCTQ